jgi:hypothetical protein
MNLLQNENAKTNRGQKLCQENDRVFDAVALGSVREQYLLGAAINFVELVLFY